MASHRGRKINTTLPSNRARDISRAFRARQAAHKQALEQRIAELEAENDFFRQLYGCPPSNRPPLGRGPTGLRPPPSGSTKPSTYPLDVLAWDLAKNWASTTPSPYTSAQSPDGSIDGYCHGGHNLPPLSPHGELCGSDEIPQFERAYMHPDRHDANMSIQNLPPLTNTTTLSFAEVAVLLSSDK